MADKWERNADTIFSPAREMWLVTPSDTVEITPLPKALRANSDGTLILQAVDSTAAVTLAVTAGELIPVRAQLVKVGTTATIHALA